MTDKPSRTPARRVSQSTPQAPARSKQRPEQSTLKLSPEELKRLAAVIKQMLKE